MNELNSDLLLMLIPVILLQLVLLILALRDWISQPKEMSNRYFWLFVILVLGALGPVFYFLVSPRQSKDDQWLATSSGG